MRSEQCNVAKFANTFATGKYEGIQLQNVLLINNDDFIWWNFQHRAPSTTFSFRSTMCVCVFVIIWNAGCFVVSTYYFRNKKVVLSGAFVCVCFCGNVNCARNGWSAMNGVKYGALAALAYKHVSLYETTWCACASRCVCNFIMETILFHVITEQAHLRGLFGEPFCDQLTL